MPIGVYARPPAIERLLAKCEVDPVAGCWLWTGALNTVRGEPAYGHFSINGRNRFVHQFAYEFWVGPIIKGHEPDHKCRVRRCFNPEHLEVVTASENRRRGLNGTTRIICDNGHFILGDNVYSKGQRRCRTCHLVNQNRRDEAERIARRRRNVT